MYKNLLFIAFSLLLLICLFYPMPYFEYYELYDPNKVDPSSSCKPFNPIPVNPIPVNKKCSFPCKNGGTCDTTKGVCKCPTGWSGDDCSYHESTNCQMIDPISDWIWNPGPVSEEHSCTDPAAVNPGKMCSGDNTSLVFATNGIGCFKTEIKSDCNFDLRKVKQIDFDISMKDCKNVWASFWATPAGIWQGGGNSGEMDFIELCPAKTGQVYSNWAGEVEGKNKKAVLAPNADNFNDHITVRNDGNGKITVGNAYYNNIYSSYACKSDPGYANCIYSFIADVWNGLSGDPGYENCMDPTYKHKGKTDNKCTFIIKNIKITPFDGKNPFFNPNSSVCKAMLAT